VRLSPTVAIFAFPPKRKNQRGKSKVLAARANGTVSRAFVPPYTFLCAGLSFLLSFPTRTHNRFSLQETTARSLWTPSSSSPQPSSFFIVRIYQNARSHLSPRWSSRCTSRYLMLGALLPRTRNQPRRNPLREQEEYRQTRSLRYLLQRDRIRQTRAPLRLLRFGTFRRR
jgi:hypothetical protein